MQKLRNIAYSPSLQRAKPEAFRVDPGGYALQELGHRWIGCWVLDRIQRRFGYEHPRIWRKSDLDIANNRPKHAVMPIVHKRLRNTRRIMPTEPWIVWLRIAWGNGGWAIGARTWHDCHRIQTKGWGRLSRNILYFEFLLWRRGGQIAVYYVA